MKILHVITSLEIGGAESLVTEFMLRFRQCGIDAELAVFNGKRTPLYEKLEKKGLKIHSFTKGPANVYNPANIFRLYRLINRGNYDIVHTHNTAPQFFAAICKVLSPNTILITTEHNTTNRRRNISWWQPIDRWMYSRYSSIICISKQAKENLDAYIGKTDHSNVILNGVDVKLFFNPIHTIPPGSPVILTMVAGLRQQKDQDTIIRALMYLPENIHLRIVGDGVRRNILRQLATDCNVTHRVDFAGTQIDIPAQLRQADIVIMSSHFEGLSLSSIEGMASGRPFIASDVDGLREVVDGAGLLFPHSDEKALAKTIMSLVDNPQKYHNVAVACQKRASLYHIDNTIRGYIDIYNSFRHT